ncbi:MAG TPA: carboxypeptidase-like regulatory domain-containing protein [Terriglobales bacterium]|nr:carboxypeptidase-like regulatory domain-containing protein [Terriglobales bacterium]
MTAQGTVTVFVVDPSGGAVQGAKLQLQDLATNQIREAETQQVGSYSFVALPTGTYKLTISKTGFQSEVLDTVVVQSNRVTDVKVALKVGAAVEKIVVSESSTPLLETTSSAIAATIDMKQIEDLPLQGRDISALAFLTPGFTGTPGAGTWNGLPLIAQGNNIDGVIASTSRMKFAGNTQPGLEARLEDLQEMTVQTGQTDLSQGLGQASMQVNFVTRRGSNDLHGRLFDDFRNTALNANSWFNNATSAPRNPIILNDFGGNAGGHIIKDKLFFFGSFAMAKQPGGFITSNTILSSNAQQGIYTFTQSVTGGPQAGQTVNLFSQVAQPSGLPASVNTQISNEQALITKAISLGRVSAGLNGSNDPNVELLSWLVHAPTTRYYPGARVDYNISSRLKLDFSLEETKVSQPDATAPPFPGSDFANQAGSFKSNNYITSVGLNWSVTQNLINQFRGGYYYNAFWYSYGSKPTWDTLPQITWPICPGGPPLNCSGNAFNLPVTTYYPIVNAVDNAAWVHGVHTITFGFDFYREQDHYWNPPDGIPNIALGLVNGDPAFNAFNTYFNSANAAAADRNEAENLYATLVGRISGVTPIGSGFPYNAKSGQYAKTAGSAYNLDELQKGWGLYAQDSFHVRPHLTFNYGLRWDFTGDDHDLTSAYHGASLASMYGPSGIGNLFKPGTLTGTMNPTYVASSHQYSPWNVSPQPTIGLAWNPNYSSGLLGSLFGGSKTVIRAGFDIKRFTEPYQYFWNNASNHGLAFFQYFSLLAANGGGVGTFAPGSLTLGTATFHPDDPTQFTLSPAAYAATIPESTYTWNYYWGASGFDPHINQPYVQEWNLGVQRQFGQNNVLEVRYVGHRSVHQWIQIDPNEVNIFENGFLKQFQAAQSNLKICMATPSCASNPSFANLGLPGQVALPIFDTAFACPPGASGCTPGADYTNGSFIIDLNQGAAGALATQLAYPFGTVPYICNLVGNQLLPCANGAFASYNVPGSYPLNFFQANPLGASFPGVTQSYIQAGGYGNYHALQMDFRQKQWHGMQFDVNYTYSHTLGLQPDNQWLGTVTEFTIRNLRQSYGPTSFDLRHVIHASGTFELPFGHGKALVNREGVIDKVVGGWSLGTIVTYQTGLPFQIFGGYGTFNDYGDGGFVLNGITKAQLQDAVGVYHTSGPYVDLINPKLLQGNSAPNCNSILTGVCQNTTPGTLGINPWLYGAHVWNDDLSLTKDVPIHERFRFSLQAEFLNLFNHPNFTTPGLQPFYFGSTNVQSSSFGQAGLLNFTNVPTNNNNSARVIELRANITF